MEVNVYIELSKINKKGKAPLRMESGKLRIPIGFSVIAKHWDQGKQKVKSGHEFYFDVNEKIDNKKKAMLQFLIQNESATRDDVIKHLEDLKKPNLVPVKKEIVKGPPTVEEIYKAFIARQVGIKSSGYLKNIRNAFEHVLAFKPDIKIEQINTKFFEGYVKYLAEKGLENVTTERYINRVRIVMKDALKFGARVSPDFEDFKLKVGTYKQFRITWEEVEQIDRFTHFNEEFNKVKDSFVFRCNTGLRDSDYNNLVPDSFVKKNGRYYISINTEKTVEDQYLVLNDRAQQIAKKYKFNLPKFSNQYFNETIKTVAKAAKIKGVYERIRHVGKERKVTLVDRSDKVSSKNCRSIFARRWYDRGGDIKLICHFLGHENETQTRHYIGLDDDDTNSEMIRVFDQGEIFK